MARRNPLAGLLRIRRAQEAAAGAEVAQARTEAGEAASTLRRYQDRLDSPVPVVNSAAWAGVMAARTSLAAEAAAAELEVAHADAVVVAHLNSWAAARAARRGVERLAERRAELERAEAARREQAALDDRAGADHHHRRERP